MTPPLNIDGSQVSAVTIDGQNVSQITIDGQEVLSAIPDSVVKIPDSVVNQLIHAYEPSGFSTSNWTDGEGTSDIDDIVGLSYDGALFGDDGGVVGDGSDDRGLSDTMGSFGSFILGGPFAIAFGFKTTADEVSLFGTYNSDGTGTHVGIGKPYKVPANKLGCGARYIDSGSGGNADNNVNTSADMNDGGEYAIIFNKTGAGASSMDIYTAPTTTDTNVAIDNGLVDGATGFDNPVAYHAVNNAGTPENFFSGALNRVYWFNDSLDEAQRTDVFDQMFPWYSY